MCIPFEYSDLELALASLAKDIHTANLEFFWHDEAFSAAWYTNAAFFNFAVIVILSQNQLLVACKTSVKWQALWVFILTFFCKDLLSIILIHIQTVKQIHRVTQCSHTFLIFPTEEQLWINSLISVFSAGPSIWTNDLLVTTLCFYPSGCCFPNSDSVSWA